MNDLIYYLRTNDEVHDGDRKVERKHTYIILCTVHSTYYYHTQLLPELSPPNNGTRVRILAPQRGLSQLRKQQKLSDRNWFCKMNRQSSKRVLHWHWAIVNLKTSNLRTDRHGNYSAFPSKDGVRVKGSKQEKFTVYFLDSVHAIYSIQRYCTILSYFKQ